MTPLCWNSLAKIETVSLGDANNSREVSELFFWRSGMTPEEVKNALNLTNDQIVRENKQEADTRSAMPHEGYTIQVQNLSLLGADILNAKFSFVLDNRQV